MKPDGALPMPIALIRFPKSSLVIVCGAGHLVTFQMTCVFGLRAPPIRPEAGDFIWAKKQTCSSPPGHTIRLVLVLPLYCEVQYQRLG